MRKPLALIAVLACVGALAWGWLARAPQAPHIVFPTLSGRQLAMDELRGRVVVVKFWATTCTVCLDQMTATIETYHQFHDKGLDLVAVAMQYDPANRVIEFTEAARLPFTVALDVQGKVARAFDDVSATPTTILVDREGRIVRRYVGEYDKAELRSAIESALSS